MCPLPTQNKNTKVSVWKIEWERERERERGREREREREIEREREKEKETERERERERESVSARLSRGTSNRTYIPFWVVHTSWLPGVTRLKSSTQTYSDQPKSQGFLQIFVVLATVHVWLCRRQSSTGSNERAKAFGKFSWSLPVFMFDSAQSSPVLPTNNFCLTKTCQMKHQTMHFEVAECFHGWWVIE